MLEPHLLQKLRLIDLIFEELTYKLEGRSILTAQELQRTLKDISLIEETVNTFNSWQKVSNNFIETNLFIQESVNDLEFHKLVTLELAKLACQISELEYQLRVLLLPKDPHDERNVILEITAGIGYCDEANIWTEDLVRIYARYAGDQNWKLKVISASYTDLGGFYNIVLQIIGDCVYGKLKFESGIHELQRLSILESKQKVINATSMISVMPEVDECEFNIPYQDLELRHYQYRGIQRRPESEVELYHKPTGLRIYCAAERHQRQNKELAVKVMRAKLHNIDLKEQQESLNYLHQNRIYVETDLLSLMTHDSRKIRSYNYLDNHVVDQRLEHHFNLEKVIAGGFDEIIQGCLSRNIRERLAELTAVNSGQAKGDFESEKSL